MLERRDFLVPHLNGEVYTHKPPLTFWAMALAAGPRGRLDETAARLPSALAAIAAVLLVHALGRRLFGPRAAWIAALAFATCARVLWQARHGQIDMLLTALVALAAWAWVRGEDERRGGLVLLFFLAAGLGTLAKGPVGLLPLLLAIVAFLVLERDRDGLRRLRLGSGLLLWAAVVAAWLVPAGLAAGSAYFRELVLTQNVTRYVAPSAYGGTRGHLHAWYYYLQEVPLDFLPWSLLLPGAVYAIGRHGTPGERRASRFLLAWVAVTVLFFSLSPAKRGVYVLQMFPALALLVGGGMDVAARVEGWRRRWLVAPAAAFGALLAAVAVALPQVAPPRLAALPALPADLPLRAAAALAAIAVAALAAAALAARRRLVPALIVLGGGFAVSTVAGFLAILPALDPVKSVRSVTARYLELAAPDEGYAFYSGQEAALQFYTRRLGIDLEGPDQLATYLEAPRERWLFVERELLADLGPEPSGRLVAMSEDPDGYALFELSGSRNDEAAR